MFRAYIPKLLIPCLCFDVRCSRYATAHPQRFHDRKFLAPAFSTNNLQKTTLAILNNNTRQLIASLDIAASTGAPVDVKQVL